MNLVEITHLINHPEVQADPTMLELYQRKRDDLVTAINADLGKFGLEPLMLKDMLLNSPEPALASTITE